MFNVLKKSDEDRIQTELPPGLAKLLEEAGFVGVLVCAPKVERAVRLVDAKKVTELVAGFEADGPAAEAVMKIARVMFKDGDLASDVGSDELGDTVNILVESGFAGARYGEVIAAQLKRLRLPPDTLRVVTNGEDIFLMYGSESVSVSLEDSGGILEEIRDVRRGATAEQLWRAISSA